MKRGRALSQIYDPKKEENEIGGGWKPVSIDL